MDRFIALDHKKRSAEDTLRFGVGDGFHEAGSLAFLDTRHRRFATSSGRPVACNSRSVMPTRPSGGRNRARKPDKVSHAAAFSVQEV